MAPLTGWGAIPHQEKTCYVVHLLIDDEICGDSLYSYHGMAKTLRLAWEKLKGIPQAEATIRRNGDMVGYLKTNFRGELAEAEVMVHKQTTTGGLFYGNIVVTPINPYWLEHQPV